jgi:hypothetical protein
MSIVKDLLIDFSGNINLGNLHREIKSSSIATSFQGIRLNGNDVELVFEETPPSGELTTLNGLVSAHDRAVQPSTSAIIEIAVNQSKIKSKTFKRIARFLYDPSVYSSLTQIKFLGYIDSDSSTYDVQVFSQETEQVVASGSFSNSTEELRDLGAISNLPTETASKLEFWVKSDDKKDIYVESVYFYVHR